MKSDHSLAVLLIPVLAAAFFSAGHEDRALAQELETWSGVSVRWQVSEKYELRWDPRVQSRDRLLDGFFFSSRLGVHRKVRRMTDASFSYYYSRQEDALEDDSFEEEQRLEFNVTETLWESRGEKWKLQLRPQFELRWRAGDFSTRGRGRFSLTRSFGESRRWQIYGYYEPYVEFDDLELSRQEIASGIRIPLSKRLTLDVAYLERFNRDADLGGWTPRRALRTVIRIEF